MEDSSYSSDESSDSSNDGIVWGDSEHFDNDFYHQQENKNNALLQDILDSLYDPPIPDNYDIDKPRYFITLNSIDKSPETQVLIIDLSVVIQVQLQMNGLILFRI